MKRVVCLILLASPFLFTACEYSRRVTGTVQDKNTGDPLELALVKPIEKPHFQLYTDTAGGFLITDQAEGMFGCPKMKVEVSAKGYETKVIKLPAGKTKDVKLTKIPF